MSLNIFTGDTHGINFYYKAIRNSGWGGNGLDVTSLQTQAIEILENDGQTEEECNNAKAFTEAYKKVVREQGESLEEARGSMTLDETGRRTDLRAR